MSIATRLSLARSLCRSLQTEPEGARSPPPVYWPTTLGFCCLDSAMMIDPAPEPGLTAGIRKGSDARTCSDFSDV